MVNAEKFIEEAIVEIKREVGTQRAIIALSLWLGGQKARPVCACHTCLSSVGRPSLSSLRRYGINEEGRD
jgi:hypothetical protein